MERTDETERFVFFTVQARNDLFLFPASGPRIGYYCHLLATILAGSICCSSTGICLFCICFFFFFSFRFFFTTKRIAAGRCVCLTP